MEKAVRVPFNKPHLTGKEVHYIYDAVSTGKISGDGKYTQLCQAFFEKNYGFKKCLLTTSCTDALEMAALLAEIEPGDEVIIPDYTFVSTGNAFALRGAKLVFCDSKENHPSMDENKVEDLITDKTKAIVCVHYAGDACDVMQLREICDRHDLFFIEDAAQAIDDYYVKKNGDRVALGSIGDFATFSFHETKNLISGEGGMLVINNEECIDRAQIIWEKGTNRRAFFRGEVDKYGWVDIGSSFLPSEVTAAFLWAQLNEMNSIQEKRKHIWNLYYTALLPHEKDSFKLNKKPDYSGNNAHMFYLILIDQSQRDGLISHLKSHGFHAVFHFLSLSDSVYIKQMQPDSISFVPSSRHFATSLLRLPLYADLSESEALDISKSIIDFF